MVVEMVIVVKRLIENNDRPYNYFKKPDTNVPNSNFEVKSQEPQRSNQNLNYANNQIDPQLQVKATGANDQQNFNF